MLTEVELTSDEGFFRLIVESRCLFNWKRGVAQNYNNDEKYYNQQKKQSEEDSIIFWKKKNISWKQDAIKTAQQNIVKAQKKLDNL